MQITCLASRTNGGSYFPHELKLGLKAHFGRAKKSKQDQTGREIEKSGKDCRLLLLVTPLCLRNKVGDLCGVVGLFLAKREEREN